MIDNSMPVAAFCPAEYDGDTFIYTEMLDRGKRKGNNGHRLVKTFYHRSVEEFWEQWPTIKQLCDLARVRACTRLAQRSYRKVGATFTRMVVEAALTDNFAGMKSLYNRACGTTSPNAKLWLFDVDVPDEASEKFGEFLNAYALRIATIPSKKGLHYITPPFDFRLWIGAIGERCGTDGLPPNVSLHKDNPTNLYIPDEAD